MLSDNTLECIKTGRPFKRLYCAGHDHRRGHAVARELVDAPVVRFYSDLRQARAIVERFNRRFGMTK